MIFIIRQLNDFFTGIRTEKSAAHKRFVCVCLTSVRLYHFNSLAYVCVVMFSLCRDLTHENTIFFMIFKILPMTVFFTFISFLLCTLSLAIADVTQNPFQ
jgi:ABC-type polysaccharide/polyol phosphate export permease